MSAGPFRAVERTDQDPQVAHGRPLDRRVAPSTTVRCEVGAGAGAVVVAEARPDQYRRVQRLLERAYGGYADEMAPAVFDVYCADLLDLDPEHSTILVATLHRTVLGTARLYRDPPGLELPAGSAWVRAVAVDPAWEGCGIGRALMHACAQVARDAGSRALYLHTTTFMTRAVRLYEQLGYRRAPAWDTDSAEHYGLTVEPSLTAFAYHLDLGTEPSSPVGITCAEPSGPRR